MVWLKLSFRISCLHFLMKRSTEPNLPSGGVQLDLRLARDSNSSFSVFPEFCLSWKKALSWTRRKNCSVSNLALNSSDFFWSGTKFKPLERTDFSAAVSGRSDGMVTTVFGGSRILVLEGAPVSWTKFSQRRWPLVSKAYVPHERWADSSSRNNLSDTKLSPLLSTNNVSYMNSNVTCVMQGMWVIHVVTSYTSA